MKALNRNQLFIEGCLMPGAHAAVGSPLAALPLPDHEHTIVAVAEGWF
jgi:hypothetical protein